jgi:hypothetical protein
MRPYVVDINADFTCKHCGFHVTTLHWVSGVIHRNHCPYCLHSRHLDLFQPGDRLNACREVMVPVGLTLKRRKDKFSQYSQGELMLVHQCTGCAGLSINRIAADDNPEMVMEVFDTQSMSQNQLDEHYRRSGIHLLERTDRPLVLDRLFGYSVEKCDQKSLVYI